ncbi:MAG: capsular biosynthesis protein [Flammeovirgaceae bacterium]|nr:capsular biosynthesis protein [Flammeovirgaceae bacterium]
MFSFFKKKKSQNTAVEPIRKIKVDMHSHLLPGIDDGAENIEQSLFLIRRFIQLGYEKLITTPHVMSDFYRNTPEIILGKLEEVKTALKAENLNIQIEAAAEYYLDEFLIQKLENNEPLLTIGDKYLLFETSFINPCSQLLHAIFLMRSSGYIPILAHPERYTYYFQKYDDLVSLLDKGVKFQMNINSLTGYYSKQSKKIAEKLVKDKAISFLGTDCHAPKHLDHFKKAQLLPSFKDALKLDLLNNSLLD